MKRWLIYGADGPVVEPIVEAAMVQGIAPILAGNVPDYLIPLSRATGCELRLVRAAEDSAFLSAVLKGVQLVVNVSPSAKDQQRLLECCCELKIDYIGLQTQPAALTALYELRPKIEAAGISVIPSLDLPTFTLDYLASVLKTNMADAAQLTLGIIAPRRRSTFDVLRYFLEAVADGGMVRKNGHLEAQPVASLSTIVPVEERNRLAVNFPLGTLASSWFLTRTPNITTYVAVSGREIYWIRALRRISWLLKIRAVRDWVQRQFFVFPIETLREEDDEVRLWAEAANASGKKLTKHIRIPHASSFTERAVLFYVQRGLAGELPQGICNPLTWGEDLFTTEP